MSIVCFFGPVTVFGGGGPWISNPVGELVDVTPTIRLTFVSC